MSEWIIAQEPVIRMGLLFSVLGIMATWEILRPRRPLSVSKPYRWINNGGIVVLYTLLLRLLVPTGAVGLAVYVETQGGGLFQVLDLPDWLAILLGVVILDFVVWAQHVFFHSVPALWRLHRMHHTDLDFDLTTGLRFHPLEILLSLALKAAAIVALGAPVLAVLLFEIILSSMALFNHSNAHLPERLDRLLRRLIVTPDFHRVHHSWHPTETNSNFGFNLSCWDRLLGTYQAQPRDGHKGMVIGINLFRDARGGRLDKLLIQPFIGPDHSYPINRRTEESSSEQG